MANPQGPNLISVLNVNPPEEDADERYGFPQTIRTAFERAADETDAVVLTRAPGRGANGLIENRHDLKGYFIKAKSCDWGPMAGFLCREPLLGKNGAAGRAFNAGEHRNYLNTLRYMQTSGTNPRAHPPETTDAIADLLPYLPDAFVPLLITDERKTYLETFVLNPALYDAATGVGIAMDRPTAAQATVAVEFLLVRADRDQVDPPSPLWAVLHGTVYVKDGGVFRPDPGSDLLLDPQVEYGDGVRLPGGPLAAVRRVLPDLRTELAARGPCQFPDTPVDEIVFFPVEGAQNPYPPYTAQDLHKNAVTGDYDLLAVWPLLTRPDLQRVSELRWTARYGRRAPQQPPTDPPASPWPVFWPVPDKPFAVESSVTRHLYLEFVPGFAEIHDLESDEKGNINDIVENVVGRLNSFAAAGYGGRVVPNFAFHSDEGGRPGVTEIEFDIGVFLPSRLRWRRRNFILTKQPAPQRDRFARLVDYLAGTCAISINAGWLHDILGDPAAAPTFERLLVRGLAQGLDPNSVAAVLNRIRTLVAPPPPDTEPLLARDRARSALRLAVTAAPAGAQA